MPANYAAAARAPAAPKRTGLKIFAVVTLVLAFLLSWIPFLSEFSAILALIVNIVAVKKGAFRKIGGVICAVAVLGLSLWLTKYLLTVNDAEAIALVDQLDTSDSSWRSLPARTEKVLASPKFEEALLERTREKEKFKELCTLYAHLDHLGYENEKAKELFLQRVREELPDRSRGDLYHELQRFIPCVDCFEAGSYYCAGVEEMLPLDQLVQWLEEEGVQVSTEKGYYEDHKDEYESRTSFDDPLNTGSKRGDVGTYTDTWSYAVYGSFLKESKRRYWAQTQSSDSINTFGQTLYCYVGGKEYRAFSNVSDIRTFLALGQQGRIYALHSKGFQETSGSVAFAIVLDDELILASSGHFMDLYGKGDERIEAAKK